MPDIKAYVEGISRNEMLREIEELETLAMLFPWEIALLELLKEATK